MAETLGERTRNLQALHRFVVTRAEERVRIAEASGDALGLAHERSRRAFLHTLGHDIARRPWSHQEVERFLLRSARRYRRHPDFETRWAARTGTRGTG